MNNFFLSCKECRIESPRNLYGSFCIGPFTGSQSLTVANALRRSLLSDLKGIAITSVQIDSVDHEFSTLVGVRESILDILLNLKEIVLKNISINSNKKKDQELDFTLKKTQIGYLQAYGPGVIRARDLNLPPSIQCVDPDQYIATLSQDGKLIMKFTINEGTNYIVSKPSSLNYSTLKKEINLVKNLDKNKSIMLLDAIFMPVNKVNYMIESYPDSFNQLNKNSIVNLEENSSTERLFNPNLLKKSVERNAQVISLEIWTNGSIHPRQALYNSLKILMNLFSQLEKVKILNSVLSKNIIKSTENYNKMFQKVQYEYNYLNQNNENLLNSSSFVDKKEFNLTEFKNNNFQSKEIYNINSQVEKKVFDKNSLLTNSNFQHIPISYLNISNRSRKLLEKSNIYNLLDLLKISSIELQKIQGFGEKCFQEIKKALEEIGLELNNS